MKELVKRASRELARSNYASALTGAGMSTESGIPDFRGPSGIWTKNPEAEQRAYQSYQKFLENPKEYWKERFSKPSLLGDLERAKPNPGHYALAELEQMGDSQTHYCSKYRQFASKSRKHKCSGISWQRLQVKVRSLQHSV
jgi:NAD-dependent deacetylase